MSDLTSYVLAIQLLLGIQDKQIFFTRNELGCGTGDLACVFSPSPGVFRINFTLSYYPEEQMREILRHELCHVKWDWEVVNNFGNLPLRERAYRHLRVEVCQKWVESELRGSASHRKEFSCE